MEEVKYALNLYDKDGFASFRELFNSYGELVQYARRNGISFRPSYEDYDGDYTEYGFVIV